MVCPELTRSSKRAYLELLRYLNLLSNSFADRRLVRELESRATRSIANLAIVASRLMMSRRLVRGVWRCRSGVVYVVDEPLLTRVLGLATILRYDEALTGYVETDGRTIDVFGTVDGDVAVMIAHAERLVSVASTGGSRGRWRVLVIPEETS